MPNLRELLVKINDAVEAFPEFLDYPVYVRDNNLDLIYQDVGIGNDRISGLDIEMSGFDAEDLGKKYVAIYVNY